MYKMNSEANLTEKTSSLKEYISAVLNNDVVEKIKYLNSLCYNKTPEEELEEKRKLNLAVTFLENFNIKVKSEYGFYRNIYDILKDLGERLDKIQYPCQDCNMKWHYETSNGEVKSCHDNCRSFCYEYLRNK